MDLLNSFVENPRIEYECFLISFAVTKSGLKMRVLTQLVCPSVLWKDCSFFVLDWGVECAGTFHRAFLLDIKYIKKKKKSLGTKLQLFHLLLDSLTLSSCVLFTTFLHSLWLLFTRVLLFECQQVGCYLRPAFKECYHFARDHFSSVERAWAFQI